jgi:hypothetical protein
VTRTGRITSLRHVHAPSLDWDGVVRDTAFAPVEDVWDGQHRTIEGGWVDHYWAKSFEEFIVKKRRGESLDLADGNFKRSFEEFFTWTFPGRAENHLPVPEPLLASLKHELGRFEAMPGYGPLKTGLDDSYAAFAVQTREDAELRRIYAEFLARYPW